MSRQGSGHLFISRYTMSTCSIRDTKPASQKIKGASDCEGLTKVTGEPGRQTVSISIDWKGLLGGSYQEEMENFV